MKRDTEDKDLDGLALRSIYDVDPPAEQDLWFIPGPPEDTAPTDLPWTAPDQSAAQIQAFKPETWQAAERDQYRALLAAGEALARFGERLKHMPQGVVERTALNSVAAAMRSEGAWLSAEQIALYRAMRIASDEGAHDLARASWAVRRLVGSGRAGGAGGAGGPGGAMSGLHGFLGRKTVSDPRALPGDDRPIGPELQALGDHWRLSVANLTAVHALTRAAYAFALWRALQITPPEERLEPSVAAMLIGASAPAAGGLAPFLPITESRRFDSQIPSVARSGTPARLQVFYGAVEAGALRACMGLDTLRIWHVRAVDLTRNLSGRTPPLLIETLMRYPVVSAELAAQEINCSRPSARRNLDLFAEQGLVREVTGQERYRFWTARY